MLCDKDWDTIIMAGFNYVNNFVYNVHLSGYLFEASLHIHHNQSCLHYLLSQLAYKLLTSVCLRAFRTVLKVTSMEYDVMSARRGAPALLSLIT